MKKIFFALIVLVLAGFGIYYVMGNRAAAPAPVQEQPQQVQEEATTTPVVQTGPESVIGTSVEGNDIMAYHFGSGPQEVLFVGGIHGGYEWNTVFLGFKLVDYLKENPTLIPANQKVTVIPVLNPDGLKKVVGSAGRFSLDAVPSSESATVPGRFNGNNVDLNRNFDCDWQESGVWRNTPVSGGASAFSEPESQALRDYVQNNKPVAVVAWYSAAGGVFASSCHNGVSAETRTILKAYADASKYPAHDDFDFYEVTGDMVNWLAKVNVPAISILLTNHTSIEWDKNLAGIQAVLKHFAQ